MIVGADAHRLFLTKPAGIPVFPPHADPAGDCLLRRLIEQDPARAEGWPAGFEGGIAHRLDTATSGVVIAARTHGDLAGVRAEFASGRLRKIYLAHSRGAVAFDRQLCEAEIAHHPRRADRMVVRRGRTAHRGKWYPAWSLFQRIADPEGGGDSGWWEVEIRTGVMHQIRVHAAFLGIPLTGDAIYGGAPGPFRLHAARVIGPGWASPVAPLPPVAALPPANSAVPPAGGAG
jgi:23S rRNA-/tRNA-specific pseudouridylate synthase